MTMQYVKDDVKDGQVKQFYPSRFIKRKSTEQRIAVRVEPSLAKVEWDYIQRILHDCGGNVTRTARRLRLHRRTLQRKLSKLPPLV